MTARLTPHATLEHGPGTLRFFLGDCLDVLPRLAPGSVDVVVTSPPYNLGVKYRSYQDTLPRDRYLAWTAQWVEAVRAVLSPHGSLFLTRPTLFHYVAARPELERRAGDVLGWVADGTLKLRIEREVPLAEAAAAHRALASRGTSGKLLLIP